MLKILGPMPKGVGPFSFPAFGRVQMAISAAATSRCSATRTLKVRQAAPVSMASTPMLWLSISALRLSGRKRISGPQPISNTSGSGREPSNRSNDASVRSSNPATGQGLTSSPSIRIEPTYLSGPKRNPPSPYDEICGGKMELRAQDASAVAVVAPSLTLKRSSTGAAMKIDEYVPTRMPQIMAKVKPRITSPPRK